MKKTFAYLLLLLLPALLGACKDDDYEYPPVKLEFLTAESGNDGAIATILPDKGARMNVSQDRTNGKFDPNTSKRIIANYEEVAPESGATPNALIYSWAAVVAAQPEPVSAFKEGIKTDAADIQSIWMGRDYLNIILLVKAQNGKHTIHFVNTEEGMDEETGHPYVDLLLYHDAGDDVQATTKRVYLSIPLESFAVAGETVDIHFSLNTYSGELKTYSFEYAK